MGMYEGFGIRNKKLTGEQHKHLKQHGVEITTNKARFINNAEFLDTPTILTDRTGNIKKSYITASNIGWKQSFKKGAKKTGLKIYTNYRGD